MGYVKFVVPVYGFYGFNLSINVIKVIEAFIIFTLLILSLPVNVKRPSDLFIHLQFLLPVVPMLVLYGAADLPRIFTLFTSLLFFGVCIIRKIKLPMPKGEILPISWVMWVLLICSVVFIFSIFMLGGWQYLNFDLRKVYQFRNPAAQSLPWIYGYLSPLVGKVVLPFVLLLAVYKKRWVIACCAIIGSILLFALTNHKGPLFYPFLLLGIFLLMRYRYAVQILLLGNAIIILSSLSLFLLRGFGTLIPALILHRLFFIPAQLNYVYYDFFSNNPHTMYSDNKFTFDLIQFPYDLDINHLIGYLYFGSDRIGANTGWIGSGYMHFDFLGMVFYAIIVGLLLSIVDSIAKCRDFAISGALLFIPLFAIFQSSDLPACMLTHGFLLALILTWSCRLRGRDMSNYPGLFPKLVKFSRLKQYII